MMTPTTTVRPFNFAVLDVSSKKTLYELPERFVRCAEEHGQPFLDHLFEVAEILCESHRIKIIRQLGILKDDGIYYTHSVRVAGRDGFLVGGAVPWTAPG